MGLALKFLNYMYAYKCVFKCDHMYTYKCVYI